MVTPYVVTSYVVTPRVHVAPPVTSELESEPEFSLSVLGCSGAEHDMSFEMRREETRRPVAPHLTPHGQEAGCSVQ